jgi:hypothetical protein
MAQMIGTSSHGVMTVAETPGPSVFEKIEGLPFTDVVGLRQGWGVTYRGKAKAGCWFHSPIPCVDLMDHSAARLGELQLFFNALGTARVTAIHLWDGDKKIKVFDKLSLTGQQEYAQQFQPSLELSNFGLNVCTFVDFGGSASAVTFISSSGRFVTA